MISVTKIFKFDAAHQLPDYEGKCQNLHGHTWALEVEVVGMRNNPTTYPGMVIDFGDLKRIVNELIIDKLDHHYINEVVPGAPTAENMVLWIANELINAGLGIEHLKLWETDTSYATWRKG